MRRTHSGMALELTAPERDVQASQRSLLKALDQGRREMTQLIEGLPVVRGGGQLPAIRRALQGQRRPWKNGIRQLEPYLSILAFCVD